MTAPKNKTCTENHDDIVRMLKSGYTLKSVAEEYNVNLSTLYAYIASTVGKVKDIDGRKMPINRDWSSKINEIIQLLRWKYTCKDLAKHFDVSAHVIAGVLRRYEISIIHVRGGGETNYNHS